MRINSEVHLPQNADTAFSKSLVFQLTQIFRALVQKVNALADGRIAAIDNAVTAAPTTGTWAQGDQLRNSTPTELGTAGSKYVIQGWICTAGGTPGTWLPMRVLTGN